MSDAVFVYTAQGLDGFWRSLENKCSFTVQGSFDQLPEMIQQLEGIGACAIDATAQNATTCIIHAYKGKRGACYDTGRQAKFHLADYAACDDDGHFISNVIAVCEKTAAIYMLPVYRPWISVTQADDALMARYADDPKDFDCDTLEADVQRYVTRVSEYSKPEELAKGAGTSLCVMYGGPFKLLVCPDGSILRRGNVQNIPQKLFDTLRKKDVHLFTWPEDVQSEETQYLHDVYGQGGVAALFAVQLAQGTKSAKVKDVDYRALRLCSADFLQRIQRMIRNKDAYLLMSGADPQDPQGCCPSIEVAQANDLCRAGIFESLQQNAAGAETCTMTVYAFRGEIEKQQDRVQYSVQESFRQSVMEAMPQLTMPLWQRLLRAALLIFVITALFISVIRIQRDYSYSGDVIITQQLYERLQVPVDIDCTIIALFHKAKRCEFCLDMEEHARRYLEISDESSLLFRNVVMDIPANREFSERLDLYTSTIVIFTISDNAIQSAEVIEELWSLTNDSDAFINELARQLAIKASK